MSVWSDLSHISATDSPGKPCFTGSEINEQELEDVILKLKGEKEADFSEMMQKYDMRELAKYIDKQSL